MAELDAKKLVESQPETDKPWKEGGSKEKKQKLQAEWKGEKGRPSQLLRRWTNVSKALAAEPEDSFTLLPKCNFVLVKAGTAAHYSNSPHYPSVGQKEMPEYPKTFLVHLTLIMLKPQ
ncbi:hypothetical protein A6R68_04852 [Neotoma lepida]|uniref:Uncharacterized protein n=1 Tax=Neotoma lepida TaxID=56216 RepID=A0A1A6GMP6_NEOLE|nr:hypothetical protein A6R68_04852 [Neotoma lepida]